ncbi:MAG: hypothetical protein IKT35_02745, partial [Clostridia bacterium]|nr:hypothetical protein [Clostridia bacterium]
MNDEKLLTMEELSPEMTEMMEQADDLIHHDLPAPPVAPEGATVEQLEADVLKAAEEKKQAEAELQAMLDQLAEQEAQEAANREQEEKLAAEAAAILSEPDPNNSVKKAAPAAKEKKEDNFSDLSHKRRKARLKAFFTTVAIVLVLALLGGAGYWYYTEHYVQMIDSLSVVPSVTIAKL